MTRAGSIRLAVVLTAAGAAIAPLPQTLVERQYSAGLYLRLQPVVTGFSSLVPYALLDIGVLGLGLTGLIVFARRWGRFPFRVWLGQLAVSTVVLAAVLYLWFLLVWGLNYRRVPLEEKIAYDQSRISREQALEIGWLAVEQVNRLAGVPRVPENGAGEEAALAASLGDVLQHLGIPRKVRTAHPKRSLLTWYFRQAAIDGMTDPFFLEIIIVPDLLPFERPHTLAHEWAHLAGFADESEANFIAWLACVRAGPLARYSGWLSAYQHLSRVLPQEDRRVLGKALEPAVIADLEAMRLRLLRASPRVSRAARGAYDTYLRANRIEEGIANYGAVVRLMLGATFDLEWRPELRRSQ